MLAGHKRGRKMLETYFSAPKMAIMPWGNYHGYEFHVRESRWGIPMPDFDFGYPVADARKATLALALSEPNFKALRYTYDIGDDWRHTIKVERRSSAEFWDEFPRLIAAQGRCPPEDVGWPYPIRIILGIRNSWGRSVAAIPTKSIARQSRWRCRSL